MGGECVPDGTIICSDGTVFDNGKCVPDDSVCGEGTVLVDGTCVPNDSTLTADAEEGAEPNGLNLDDGLAGTIEVPDVGADGFVIHGCVDPFEDVDNNGDLDPDFDSWLITVDGPTLLDVSADGVGGLAAGFTVLAADAALNNDGWQRFGINMVGDTSQRQIFLPVAGDYLLAMTDSRSLFLDAAGSADACYFTTITQLAIPTPTALSAEVTTGTTSGNPEFFSYTAADGDILNALMDTTSQTMQPGLVFTSDAAYRKSAGGNPAQILKGGVFAAAENVVVVDPVFAYGLNPAPWSLTTSSLGAVALPDNGDTATVTSPSDNPQSFEDVAWMYFDATAGDMVHLDLQFSSDVLFLVFDEDLNFISNDAPVSGINDWFRLPTTGTYYVGVADLNNAGPVDLGVTGDYENVAPTPLAIGTPVTDEALSALEANWFTVDLTDAIWIQATTAATNFDGDVGIGIYRIEDFTIGRPDFDFFGNNLAFAAAGGELNRVAIDDDAVFLIRVTDTGVPTGSGTFDIAVANRDFTDLDTVTEAAPVDLAAETVAATEDERYFVRATPGADVTITVTGTGGFDAVLETLDADENILDGVDDTGADEAETLTISVAVPTWIAFQVSGSGGAGGDYDLSVSSVDPVPYTVASGNLPFIDACADGAVVTMNDDGSGFGTTDEGLSDPITLPFAFDLFGAPVTDFIISTNGWLTFDPTYAGSARFNADQFPSTNDPNGVVAPLWDDLAPVTICQVEPDADTVVIEWVGEEFGFFGPGDAVEYELVLHSDGSMDFIYGDNQVANGSNGSIGAENLNGGFGQDLGFFEFDTAVAGTSYTLTPQ